MTFLDRHSEKVAVTLFFTKPTYEEIKLPFILDDDPGNREAGLISVEAYGNVLRQAKYCYAVYRLKNFLGIER